MGHNIDLKQYQVRTDLAIDVTTEEQKGFTKEIEKDNFTTVTTIVIDEEGEKNIHKKKGTYVTIEFQDVTDFHTAESIQTSFQKHLSKMILDTGIKEKDTCLVIGLGNDRSTPDALGPNTIDHILVTRHLFTLGTDVETGFRNVAAISPGVMGETGIETSDVILSIVDTIKPDFLLIVDALASSSLERVNKTIQMTDTGIHPGSGVGNERKEISKEKLGIPVIAIGVPTVVDAVTIVGDTMQYTLQHFSKTNAKEEILGLLATLTDDEIKQLIFEVLTEQGYNLIVTPKEVDFMVEKLSEVLGEGINHTLHPNVTVM